MVTDSVPVPTIGIGAGRHCDGQVLVYHDILGFRTGSDPGSSAATPRARRRDRRRSARFAADVRAGTFPSSEETYHAADGVADALGPLRLGGSDRTRQRLT